MQCKLHYRDVTYMCRAKSCGNMALCQQCLINHESRFASDHKEHKVYIMPIKKAIELGIDNLNKNKKKIEDIIAPYEKQKQIELQLKQQLNQLRKEKQRIINIIENIINEEINQLKNKNDQVSLRKDESINKLTDKLQQIRNLQKDVKLSSDSLKKSLDYEIQTFLSIVGREQGPLTSLELTRPNEFYMYDSIKHDFFMNKNELQKRNVTGKPLKKNQNQSPLYFLIDQQFQTSPVLHFFSSDKRLLRMYNVVDESWKLAYSPQQIALFITTVQDPKSNRFYIIGGKLHGRKSDSIIWYDNKRAEWGNSRLRIPRSSAMSVIIKDSNNTMFNKILIVGGFNQNGQALKSCQLFDPQRGQTMDFGLTNFGSSSGTLVNFNNNIILKIGGLSVHGDHHAICQLVEKLQYQKQKDQINKVWNYIELQDVNNNGLYHLLYANQAAIQINHNEIMIFGGSYHNSKGTTETYILEIQNFKVQNWKKQYVQANRYYARWVNQKPLISAEDFKGLTPIIWNRKIYSFQNISNHDQVYENQKKIVEFDMFNWYETEIIVND